VKQRSIDWIDRIERLRSQSADVTSIIRVNSWIMPFGKIGTIHEFTRNNTNRAAA